MAIFNGSRYAGQHAVDLIKDNKRKVYIGLRDNFDKEKLKNKFSVYIVKEGDEIDLIAYKFGISPSQWWIIADLNDLFFAFDLHVGQSLIIPNQDILKDL